MFIGHIGIGFAAKAYAPRGNLGTYLAAALLMDLIWPLFAITGLEKLALLHGPVQVVGMELLRYPWSHGLVFTLAWAGSVAGYHYGRFADRRVASTIAVAVTSHWLLDWIGHDGVMDIAPGVAPRVSAGLAYSTLALVAVEGGVFAVGLAWYLARTRATSAAGHWLLGSFMAAVLAIYAWSLTTFPQTADAVVLADLGGWLLVLWGWAVDRRRVAR